MLLLTALVAVVVGGLTWQWRLVLQRQATLAWIQTNGGGVVDAISGATVTQLVWERREVIEELGRIRALLGDRRILFLYLPANCADQRDRIAEIFPEAEISLLAADWEEINNHSLMLLHYDVKIRFFKDRVSLE
jgi:hypothetical protein